MTNASDVGLLVAVDGPKVGIIGIMGPFSKITPIIPDSPITFHNHTLTRMPTSSSTAGLPIRWTLGRCWDDVITRSDFKSETIFGFLSLNYMGQHTWFFGTT